MARSVSGVWITFAVLNFIVGGFLLLCSVCSAFDNTSMTVNGRDVAPDLRIFVERVFPNYQLYKILLAVFGFILGGGFIAGGVGLVLGQGWGRIISFVFGFLGLFHHVLWIILQLFYINPAVDDFFRQFQFFNPAGFYKTVMIVGVLIYALFGIYYIAMLITLSANGPHARGPVPQEDYDRPRRRPAPEDDWDDRPRRRREEDDDLPPPRQRR